MGSKIHMKGLISMEKILKEILGEIKEIKTEMSSMNQRIGNLEAGQDRIEKKLDTVYEQTATLTEFRTEVNQKLDNLTDDVEFLKHKEYEHEQDIFRLKRNIQVSK